MERTSSLMHTHIHSLTTNCINGNNWSVEAECDAQLTPVGEGTQIEKPASMSVLPKGPYTTDSYNSTEGSDSTNAAITSESEYTVIDNNLNEMNKQTLNLKHQVIIKILAW